MKAQRFSTQWKWLAIVAAFCLVAGVAGVATAASLSYLHFAGNNFIPIDSSVATTYASYGCISITAAGQVKARVELPKDAVIKYIRLYYYANDTTNYITLWITRYGADSSYFRDIIWVNSPTPSTGAGYVDSPEITETVDNSTYSYVLIATVPVGSNYKLCGARIAYYQPPYLIIE
jgi:hypothetical protein